MKILVISNHQQAADRIRDLTLAARPSDSVTIGIGERAQLDAVIEANAADVAVLDDFLCETGDLRALEGPLHRRDAPVAILLCSNPTAELLLEAMRMGVREVLPSPTTQQALREALDRIEKRDGADGGTASRGQVLAFMSCKGGGGATFLATNLAYALAEGQSVKVALFDLNLQAGDAAIHVSDRQPAMSVADMVRDIGRLDGSYLAASMISVAPNFGVLAAPSAPERALDVLPEHIDALLTVAVAHYDYVFVDVSRVLDAAAVRALDRAVAVYPVLQLTVPFVRDAKRLLATFDALGYERSRIQLVVNRFEKNGELGIKEVERSLDTPVAWTIPNSFRSVTSSVNQGIPILKLFPHDPVSRALQAMAAGVVRPNRKVGSRLREMLHLT
jgi:pilus assembly protein CpaE